MGEATLSIRLQSRVIAYSLTERDEGNTRARVLLLIGTIGARDWDVLGIPPSHCSIRQSHIIHIRLTHAFSTWEVERLDKISSNGCIRGTELRSLNVYNPRWHNHYLHHTKFGARQTYCDWGQTEGIWTISY